MPQGATVALGLGSKGAPHRAPVRGAGYRGVAAGCGSLCSASWPRATASCRSAVLRCHNEIAGRRPPSRATALSASAARARSSAADRACSALRSPLRRSTTWSSSSASSPAPGSSGTSAPHQRAAASKAMKQSMRSSDGVVPTSPCITTTIVHRQGPPRGRNRESAALGSDPTRGARGCSGRGRAAAGTGMPRRRASRVSMSSWVPAAV